MNKNMILLAALMLSGPAIAADEISLDEPGCGGTGCPAGMASATLSPDANALSVLFEPYKVAFGGQVDTRSDRTRSPIGIPVHGSQGLSGTVAEDYSSNNTLNVQSVVWSGFGPDGNSRTHVSTRVKTDANPEAMASSGSDDVSAEIAYELRWHDCG